MVMLDKRPGDTRVPRRQSQPPTPKKRWLLLLLMLAPLLLPMLMVAPALLVLKSHGGHSSSCAPAPGLGMADSAATVDGLNPRQRQIAATIVGHGEARHISIKGQTIAVAVAQDESTLRNLANPNVRESLSLPNDGKGQDHNSVGVFQQQPDQGWGTPAELMDPAIATDKFYDALLKVPGWESMQIADAAAAVQHNLNGAPDYARFETSAAQIVTALQGSGATLAADADSAVQNLGCNSAAPAGAVNIPNFVPGGPPGPNAVAAAASQLGVEYAWGGGGPNGPSRGTSDGGGAADAHGDYNKTGFDCSGLAQFAIFQATGKVIPDTSEPQSAGGAPVASQAEAQPGDLVFFGGEGVAHHVGVYIGGGQMIAAPQSGERVKQQPVSDVGGPITYRRYT